MVQFFPCLAVSASALKGSLVSKYKVERTAPGKKSDIDPIMEEGGREGGLAVWA